MYGWYVQELIFDSEEMRNFDNIVDAFKNTSITRSFHARLFKEGGEFFLGMTAFRFLKSNITEKRYGEKEKVQVLEIVDARKTCSIMKEVRVMEYLLAKSDRQLGICLRMLYDEGYKGLVVESVINAKNRMEFHVKVMADEDKMAKLNDRYQTLIS